jgi:Spy/CpxP family protein refolding chaperone
MFHRPTLRMLTASAALAAFSGFGLAGTLGQAALGAAPAAFAQDAPAPQSAAGAQRGQHMMGEALMSLNLNDGQKDRIRAIMADARKQNQNVTDRMQRRANMRAALKKVETVLTPAQAKVFHAKMDEMRKQWQQSHPDAH